MVDINETLTNFTLDSRVDEDHTEALALEDKETEEGIRNEFLEYQPLVHFIESQFRRSKDKRRNDEYRWLECWKNYRGIYDSSTQFRDTEKSRVFIKITKTKVLAAFAQINDILFTSAAFPIGVEPSNLPVGIAESVHFDPEDPDNQPGDEGPEGSEPQEDEPVYARGTVTREEILEIVGPVKSSLSKLPEHVEIKEGPGKTPTAQTWEPAKIAARKMEKKILDQLESSGASKSVRNTIFEMCTFGAGIFKGPFAKNKEYPKWNEDGTYQPLFKVIPDVNHVSIWNAYPDPDANNMDDAEYFIERHRMSKSQMRALKNRPYFRSNNIDEVIEKGMSYVPEDWELHLDESETRGGDIRRFEVLEYWGILDKDIAKEADMEIPKEFEDRDEVQVNAWICNGYILRLVLNPFTPSRIPYFIIPYELNPYSIFGVGVAENMQDTQAVMNGFMRLGIDNSALSANVVLEVNENNLVPGQSMDVYPGKVFRTNGQVGTSINAINIPNVSQETLMMFDKARQLADEATGMPSYSHGQSGVTGVGRTASGMSMLMGAAKENIKSVVRNVDDYLLVPLGKSMFAFNMQFDFDPEFIGDLEVVAKGTESLMRNEIRGQRLLQFYQVTANPMDAPWTKRDYLLREIAASLDIDPEKTVNDAREAAIQAERMKELQQLQGIDPNQPQGGPQPPEAGLDDPTGQQGMAVPGMAPEPGADGFSGNPQESQEMNNAIGGMQ